MAFMSYDPWAGITSRNGVPGDELVAGLHGQQMLHGQVFDEPLGHGTAVLGEQIHQLVRGSQQAVIHQQADGHGRDALAGGESHPGQFQELRAESGLTQEFAIAQNQHTVHPQSGVLVQSLQKPGDLPGGNAFALGDLLGQRLGGLAQWNFRLLHAEILHGFCGSFGIQQPHQQLHGAVGRGERHGMLLSVAMKNES